MMVAGTLTHEYYDLHVDTGQRPDRWDDTYFAFYPYRQYTTSLLFGGIFLLGTGLTLFWRSHTQGEILLSRRTRVATSVSVTLTVLLLMWVGAFIGFDPGPMQTHGPVDFAIWSYFITNVALLPLLFITGLVIVSGLAKWLVRRFDKSET